MRRNKKHVTYAKSGPTSLFPVVSTLDAAHPEMYTTSWCLAICVIWTGSIAPIVRTGLPSAAALERIAYSLSARSVDGRGMAGREPCFNTTSEGVYGRRSEENRGWEKKADICAERSVNWVASAVSENGSIARTVDGLEESDIWREINIDRRLRAASCLNLVGYEAMVANLIKG